MALGMYFTSGVFTPAQYDEAIKRLEAAGGIPGGEALSRRVGIGWPDPVFDVWDSEELFQAFGATLMPVLTDLGVDPGEPQVSPVHNIIEG